MIEDKDILVLAMSAIAIFVSVWAKRDSTRSADAAEKSAQEAARSRKLSQFDALAPAFHEAAGYWRMLAERDFSENYNALHGVEKLKSAYSADKDFSEILDNLERKIKQNPTSKRGLSTDVAYPDITPEDTILKEQFDAKKREYLSIG